MYQQSIIYLSICLSILASMPVLYNYWAWDIQLILCILVAPIAFRLRYPQQKSTRYLLLTLLFLGIFGFTHIKLSFLLGVGCGILLLIEGNFGKLGEMPLVFLGLLSPILQYIAKVFTFPIRLWLSKTCGKIFSFFHFPIQVSGNVFEIDNISFAVDTACMGLNMLSSSLAICALLVAFGEQRTQKRLAIAQLTGIFLLAFFLILVANLFRIIILVLFRAMPETYGHEIIGLLCWGVYVILPLYFLIQFLYQKKGILLVRNTENIDYQSNKSIRHLLMLLCVPFSILLLALTYSPLKSQDEKARKLTLAGFQKSIVEHEIVKFEHDSLLIYLKPAIAFYGTDHNPTICWQASGYTFHKMEIQNIDNQDVFIAELHKGADILYTAWWYDNGKEKTVAQLHWRWQMMKGEEPYRLINVSSPNFSYLKKECAVLLKKDWF